MSDPLFKVGDLPSQILVKGIKPPLLGFNDGVHTVPCCLRDFGCISLAHARGFRLSGLGQNDQMEREALFEVYDSTLVTVLLAGEWFEAEAVVKERGEGAVVMTAWNPGWERPSLAENEAANEAMFAELASGSHEIVPAVGASVDEAHSEPGFLIWGMDPQLGCEIARRYGQFAIYVSSPDGTRETVDCL